MFANRRAAHDVAALHHEAGVLIDKHTAAAVLTNAAIHTTERMFAADPAGDDPALNDLGARVFVQRPKAGGLLDEFVYGGGVAVHQRQRAALYLNNAAAAGYLQHKAVQVQRHVTPNDQRMRQVHIIAQIVRAAIQRLFADRDRRTYCAARHIFFCQLFSGGCTLDFCRQQQRAALLNVVVC